MKLSKCPCGGEALQHSDTEGVWYTCENRIRCGLRGQRWEGIGKAVNAWNERCEDIKNGMTLKTAVPEGFRFKRIGIPDSTEWAVSGEGTVFAVVDDIDVSGGAYVIVEPVDPADEAAPQ